MSNELIVAIITAVTTSVVGPVVVHYVQSMVERRKKDTLLDAIEANQMINDKLDQIRKEVHSDRIWLIQFHNGAHFYPTGKSIQKFSMVYEITSSGTIPCQTQFQNIPVSLFSKSIHTLYKGAIISIPDTTVSEKQFEGFTSVIHGANVKSTYMIPLYNIKNEFIGIVGVDYVSKKRELKEKELTNIDLELSTIGGVLNNYLKL
jgi:hypothetical protein